MKKLIAVCGSDDSDEVLSDFALKTAENVGRLIASKGGIVVCGGRGGIMRAVCLGAKEKDGTTIGILPDSKYEANEFVDIPIVTGLGHKRNFLVVNSADVVIAIAGRWGTLNEISFSMIFKKPVILIKGTGGCVDEIIYGNLRQDGEYAYHIANSAEDAVNSAFGFIDDI
jgi:uncharacterized protein (TIGR00725 family)